MPPLAHKAFASGKDKILANPEIGQLHLTGPLRGHTVHVEEHARPPLMIHVGIAYECDYVRRVVSILAVGGYLENPKDIKPAKGKREKEKEAE